MKAKQTGKATDTSASKLFDQLEERLSGSQWMDGGASATAADREALEQVAPFASQLDPKAHPNTFGWYSIASRFTPEK